MKVLIKPKVTKPWSKEMYEYNDKVAKLMKTEILDSIHRNKNNWNQLNKLISICGGVRYGEGFTINDLYNGCLEEITMVQNYWLDQEWDYAVKQNVVRDVVPYKMVGYGK